MSENKESNFAPGWPGIPARWSSSAKSGIGKALGCNSPLWFTMSHGIINEVYYPRIDQACIRDMGFIVTDGENFFSEEKRQTISKMSSPAKGIPAFQVVNESDEGIYKIEKQIITDPHKPVLLQKIRFTNHKKSDKVLHLYIIVAPHLGNHGEGNTGWIGDYKGVPMLFASRNNIALALACSHQWNARSIGFVGASDGWKDLSQHKIMTWEYCRAENGNLALTAEIGLTGDDTEFIIALGFGTNANEAGIRARSSLQEKFGELQKEYERGWKTWQNSLEKLKGTIYSTSTAVLKSHLGFHLPGGAIASLSIPWGFSKGDGDLGGYHLVWPRDLVQTAEALIASGAADDARNILWYLRSTQEADGHWAQNMWLDGTPYWNDIQMDETALPILLADLAFREKIIDKKELQECWLMVKNAVAYLAQNGPVSPQDRWEEDPGYSPFTVAAEIAALLAAADIADLNLESHIAKYLRELADIWNEGIDRWMYVTESDWCKEHGVEGYYERIAEVSFVDGIMHIGKDVLLKNHAASEDEYFSNHMVSPDVLALVRFGLREPNDKRIRNTLKIIDTLLKVDTSQGPVWHRYDDDGYGEHADGSPFDGTGIGRAWPLLTGERAHYELASGNIKEAKKLLKTMESLSNEGGLLPEQVWDAADIPERELFFGKPTGSAMPLVWAHAEYIKLLRSIRDNKIFGSPPQTAKRYLEEKTISNRMLWRFNNKIRTLFAGQLLRIETLAPAIIRWTADDWMTYEDVFTSDSGVGLYFADLETGKIPEGNEIIFTFLWKQNSKWEGVNFSVNISTSQVNKVSRSAPSDEQRKEKGSMKKKADKELHIVS